MNYFKPEDFDFQPTQGVTLEQMYTNLANAKLERECVEMVGRVDEYCFIPKNDCDRIDLETHKALMLPPERIKQETCADVLEGWANACNGSGIVAWEHWKARAKAALARVPK